MICKPVVHGVQGDRSEGECRQGDEGQWWFFHAILRALG